MGLLYPGSDQLFALRLKKDLQAYGFNIFDLQDSQRGDVRLANDTPILVVVSNNLFTSVQVRGDLQSFDNKERAFVGVSADGTTFNDHMPPPLPPLNRLNINGRTYKQIFPAVIQALEALGVVPNKEEVGTLHIRIVEEPLTAQNLNTIILALTELSTKYWLISKRRLADLIEYTQTHNGRFAEEANVIVTRITYNSPMNMDWKVDLSAPSVAEALVTTIDGITQARKRLEKAELENQAMAQEIKHLEEHANHEQQMSLLEQEKYLLEIEQNRLEIMEKRLEVQKKGIEYALEIASKVVDTLHPNADSDTRTMEIQTLLAGLLQLQNGKGLELVFPIPQERSAESK